MFVYEVRIELPDAATRDEVLAWLEDDHLRGVVEAGAESGEATVLDGEAHVVLCRYLFASREAFAAYEAGPAEALRADGRARLSPDRGIRTSRLTGDVRLRRERS